MNTINDINSGLLYDLVDAHSEEDMQEAFKKNKDLFIGATEEEKHTIWLDAKRFAFAIMEMRELPMLEAYDQGVNHRLNYRGRLK